MEKVATGLSQVPQRPCKGDGRQVDDMLKVIPPKVYITDSSSFKRLVQELTGNGSHAMSSPSPPPMQEELGDQVPIINIDEHSEPEVRSLEGEACNRGVQLCNSSQASAILKMSPLAAFTALQTGWINQIDEFQYQEFNPWSMDTDPFPFCDGFSLPTEELFSFQYDLSELSEIL